MIQPQQGIFRFIFGADCEQNAKLFLFLQIALQFIVSLSHGGFLSDFNAFLSIVSNDAAPKSIVQIQCQHLFIAAENGLNDAV